jgi:hypothetical protein
MPKTASRKRSTRRLAGGAAVALTLASDYASPRWFKLSTPVGVGFTHSSLVENQTTVGRCPGY